jgi:CheY-like chemotaxis protein
MNERPAERRRHVRIVAKGTLLFRAGKHEQSCRIANLSESGAYVLTNVTAPDRMLGRNVALELRLDAGSAEWLRATGRIIRKDLDGVAIAFDLLAAPLLRIIDALSTASLAGARILVVVLIDADPRRRDAMATGFRAAGCSVVEATSPLEAIVRLGESTFEPDVIAVADSQSDDAEQMREFVEREHPNATLIRIGDELLRPAGRANWLSSGNPDQDLAARVREALVAPHRRP